MELSNPSERMPEPSLANDMSGMTEFNAEEIKDG